MSFRAQASHLVAAGLLSTAALAANGYEDPPTLRASELLPPELLRGPHHLVAEDVRNDGFWNHYRIQSNFGRFWAHGAFQLRVRLREVEAIAQLRQMSGREVTTDAAVDSLKSIGDGLETVVRNPEETLEGVGDGVKRLFKRSKRDAKRAKEKATHDDEDAAGEDESTIDKIEDAAVGAGKSAVGLSAAKRRWAQSLGVDPYSRNAVLQKELDRVAAYDAAGRVGKKLLLRATPALSVALKVSGLVWQKDPDELITLIETRLKVMGVSDEDSRALRLNEAYTLSRLTLLTTALHDLGDVPGRADFVAQAAEADSEEQAIYFTQSALLMFGFHEKFGPAQELAAHVTGAALLTGEGRLVHLSPIDHVVWTQELENYEREASSAARQHHPHAERKLWLTGTASERVHMELEQRGWTIKTAVLPAANAALPQ